MPTISEAFAAHPIISMQSGILFPVAVPDGSGGYLIQDNATSWDALQAANPAKLAVLAATTTGITGTYDNGPNNDGIGATFQLTSTAIPSFDGAEYNTVGTGVSSSLLIKNQGSGAGSAFENGIWYLSTAADVGVAGAIFTRRSDYNNTNNVIEGSYVNVVSGTQAGLWSMDLGGPINVGSDPITFTDITPILPKIGYTAVYVNNKGDDSTGDGSTLNPYQTIQGAMTSITDAGIDKQYVIISSGIITDSSCALKPFISIFSDGSPWLVSAITLDSSINGAVNYQNTYRNLCFAADATFDLTFAQQMNFGTLTFIECGFTSTTGGGVAGPAINIILNTPTAQQSYQFKNCDLGGLFTGSNISFSVPTDTGSGSAVVFMFEGGCFPTNSDFSNADLPSTFYFTNTIIRPSTSILLNNAFGQFSGISPILSSWNIQLGDNCTIYYDNSVSPSNLVNTGTGNLFIPLGVLTDSVTFAPNGTAGGTVFTDWSSLCTYVAFLNQDQEITIYFDAGSGSITLPSGTFSLPNSVRFKGIGTSALGSIPVVVFTNNTILSGITQFTLEDVKLWANNTSSPVITTNAINFVLKLYDAQMLLQGGSTQPLISLTNVSELLAYIHGLSIITGISGVATITADSGSAPVAEVNVFDSSQIQANGMTMTIPIMANLDAIIDTSYSAVTYTGNQRIVTQTSGFTLSLIQARQLILCNSASSFLVTVPTNASVGFPVGTEIDFMQQGVGKVTFAKQGGVTIDSQFGDLSIANQYSGATLKQIAIDTWWLFGNLST